MKPSRGERENLACELRRQQVRAELSQVQLSALAKVDPSQTSRILGGQFRTLSGNVLQICKALDVNPQDSIHGPDAGQAQNRAAWAKLEASLRRAWDQTPQGAERLVAVIDAVARVHLPKTPEATDLDASVPGAVGA